MNKILALCFAALFSVNAFAQEACVCLGGCIPFTPTPTLTATSTPTVAATATSTATPTATFTFTPTSTATATPTIAATATATATPVSEFVFRPTYFSGIISNPGIGWQTTRETAAQPNPRGMPLKHATFRTCMSSLNPSPGVFNWSEFDQFLVAANAQGQKVQLGVIAGDPYDCSGWLRAYVPSVQVYCQDENPGRSYWMPDWNQAITQQRHREFQQAFAARYNNDPRVESVDVRSIGDYGEWHHSCLRLRSNNSPWPMPNVAARRAIIKDYHDFWTNKRLVHVLDDVISREEAIARGAGLRHDCAGGFHHEKPDGLYANWMSDPDMTQQYKTNRIEAEPCGSIYSTSYPLATKVDQMLGRHVSMFNSKNALSPTNAQWVEVQRFLKYMGYRYVVEEVRFLPQTQVGQDLGVRLNMRNEGVAPCYEDSYRLAIRLKSPEATLLAYATACELPGSYVVQRTIPLTVVGTFALQVAIVDANNVPVAQFANVEKDAQGWMTAGQVVVYND